MDRPRSAQGPDRQGAHLVLSRREGWLLLALYGLFVLWLGLETAGVTEWVGG